MEYLYKHFIICDESNIGHKRGSRSILYGLLKSLDYINVLKEIKDKRKSKAIQDLAESFNDVKSYEEGKKQLKSAKDLLNEL